jgi:hypothetical protein
MYTSLWEKFEGKLFSNRKCGGPLLQRLPLKDDGVGYADIQRQGNLAYHRSYYFMPGTEK